MAKRKMLTKSNWKPYHKEFGSTAMFAYLDATRDLLPKLKGILNSTRNYKELKKELLDFLNDRNKFCNSVYESDNIPT